jgi:hypothetical protein
VTLVDRPPAGGRRPPGFAARTVDTLATWLGRGASRRGFLVKTALVGSALATNPLRFLLRPGTAYASVCGPEADCASGWTVFCCSINNGQNSCPPGTIPAGWWKADNSPFCGAGPRYYLDCNAGCGSCGCGPSGICSTACNEWSCHCGTNSCDQRRVACNNFRYGNCHQEIACVGAVVCRVVTCMPPWEWDASCTRTPATANATALHHAPCLDNTDSLFAFGAARDDGAPPQPLHRPVVGIEATASGNGYWVVAADGGIFAFGDAPFLGSTGGTALREGVVDMAATPSGRGYWLVARDGGVFAFGNASFHGSLGGIALVAPIVGIAATPSGRGYWLVARDGGVFTFGDAQFHGSLGGVALRAPIVGIARTPSGRGYWLAASDGGVFAFGDARFHGSLGDRALPFPVTGIAATAGGQGYWMLAEDGGVFAFGDARFHGSLGADGSARGRAVDLATRPDGRGYWIATD